ncbi:MAG: hypothetical protein U1U88_001427, partial [Lawsonella clevelandensis]
AKVAGLLPPDQATSLNDLAIKLSGQGTAIIFVVCGVVTLLTVFLSKWASASPTAGTATMLATARATMLARKILRGG